MAASVMKMKIGLTLIGVVIVLMSGGAESMPNTNIVEWRCNANSYSQSDAYAGNVEYVIADLVAITPNTGFDYLNRSPSDSDICYGWASCGTNKAPLTAKDCSDCLNAARDAVMNICSAKIGALLWMVDCSIRYENYPF